MADYNSSRTGAQVDAAVSEVNETRNKVTGRYSGAGAPTTSTAGRVGDLYTDTLSGDMYRCTAVDDGVYTWTTIGGGGGGVPYCTCDTDGTTAAKVVNCSAYSHTAGAMIAVEFEVTNTAVNPTLNVSDNGALAIYYHGAAITAGYLVADHIYTLVYDGTRYEIVGDINVYGTAVDDTLSQQGQAADAKATGDAITTLQSDVSDINDLMVNAAVDLSNDNLVTALTTGYVSSGTQGTAGTIVSNSAFSYTNPIIVTPGEQLEITGSYGYGYSYAQFKARGGFYTSAGAYIKASQLAVIEEPYTVTVPAGAATLVVNCWYDVTANNGALMPGFSVRRFPASYSPIMEAKYKVERIGCQYARKVWASFGDSITFRGGWQEPIATALHMGHVNCGIGSTRLAGIASTAFWQDARLNTVKSTGADVVTILGGANDIVAGIPIGTTAEFTAALANKDKNTFLGAYSYIVENLLTWKPTLKIILLTTTYAHLDGVSVRPSGCTLTYSDYAEATRQVAAYYGLPCADLHGKTGFNALTQSTFTSDGIHPNDAGNARIAACVLGTMISS